MGLSEELFDRAVKVIPGGVNSPVRAYGAIGIAPRFIDRADGCHIYDVDGKEYVDYIDSWGPMILGHNFPEVKESVLKACEKGLSFGCATAIEVEMAEFICDHIPHVDMVRMVNSGTEAVMSAVRVARGFTGKNKIIKFAGCYHGHSDAMLVSAGSGVMTSGVPDSAGVPKGCTEDTMTAVYNDLDSVRALMEQADGQTAAVIVEAVGANMGVVPPKKGFLEGLRKLCDEYGALLIFDEVITGFRLAFGGAAEYFGVTPDLVTYGKIIGLQNRRLWTIPRPNPQIQQPSLNISRECLHRESIWLLHSLRQCFYLLPIQMRSLTRHWKLSEIILPNKQQSAYPV